MPLGQAASVRLASGFLEASDAREATVTSSQVVDSRARGASVRAEFTTAELEAYLDEALAVEQMAEIEQALRSRPELVERLARINARRDCGLHTIGEIWRRHQIGVPAREELGSYLLGVLREEHAAYIRFRLHVLKCRYTTANLMDLQDRQQEADSRVTARRRKYFESSVGRMRE